MEKITEYLIKPTLSEKGSVEPQYMILGKSNKGLNEKKS